jgi:AraC-like DNA-binding protein
MLEQPLTPVTFERKRNMLRQQAVDQLLLMTEKRVVADGKTPTIIPFLSLYRYSRPMPLIPSVLTPSFCLVLQGAKVVHFGQDRIEYRAGHFLASVIDMPAIAQVVDATPSSPYIGLRVDLTTQDIASVVTEAGIGVKPREEKNNLGAFIGTSNADLLDLFIRLLKLLDQSNAAGFLAPLIKREMIFHLLSGEYGHLFFQQVLFDQQAEGVGRAIVWIKEHYVRSFTVEELATANHMSVSRLHHKFKAITSMGPLQYQKRLRLQEARRLMLSGRVDATTAALEVGYKSPSQFSREYRRLFGLPPLQEIKAMRKHASVGAFLEVVRQK